MLKCYRVWGLPLSLVKVLRATLLRKTDTSSSSHQLPIALSYGWTSVPTSLSVLGFCLAQACTSIVHAVKGAVTFYVQLSSVHSFFVVIHPLWLL